MKSFNILLVILAVAITGISTDLRAQETGNNADPVEWTAYGTDFSTKDPVSGQSLVDFYESLDGESNETVQLKGEVSSVCQVKGCWMVVDLENKEQVRITFKDYGFFVPTDIAGKEVVVNGRAMVSEISEADQRHYAKDAGYTDEEIDAIKGSKKTYTLVADGVRVN